MLSNKKSFVVTIGNYGSVVALHDSNEIKNKIFLEELSDEAKIDLKNLFTKNPGISILVILDTIDQSYKKKTYPLIKKSDLEHIVKRDMANDGGNEGFKGYIILSDKKPLSNLTKLTTKSSTPSATRSECLFVSASNSEITSKWLDFLLDMPNHITGIHMLPVESFRLLELLKPDIRSNSGAKNTGQENVYFMILQNKVSGVRQMIFSENGIIFTRSMNYNFNEPDFLEKYEQDIYSTFEYLKRLVPDIRISEVDIINIFSNEVLDQLKTIASSELNFVNYTPFTAAKKVGQDKILPENANFCDLLLSRVFSASKKRILKFSTPRLTVLERFFNALQASYYLNITLACLIIFCSIAVFLFEHNNVELLSQAQSDKMLALQEVNNIKIPDNKTENILTDNGNPVDIERVIDFGKVDELMTSIGTNLAKPYVNMRFLKNDDVTLNSFTYSLKTFDYKNPAYSKYSFSFQGDMINKNGDIDNLFKSFDLLTTKTKKAFPNDDVKYNEIPHNIDFVQKYYTFPVEFTISQK